MGAAKDLLNLVRDRELAAVDVDSAQLLSMQREILQKKTVLRQVFTDIYADILQKEARFLTPHRGLRVELGAGVGFLKNLDSDVLITDVKAADHLDRVVDAQAMPFTDRSLRTLICVNCFHHIPDPMQFFRECQRVLLPGGGLIVVDPYESLLGRFLYPRLFATESFDMSQPEWRQEMSGPSTGANQALSYIVFKRDRQKFLELFPTFEIVDCSVSPTFFRYLASGGFFFRSLLPGFVFPFLAYVERKFKFLHPLFGLHGVYIIRKKESV